MAQVINTNIASLNAQRNLNTSQTNLATSLQRLSSGLRINSAKDDAAGLAISDRMTSQINGLNQAIRNANDGISLAQTAEGALSSASSSLQRLRELAVQSANASNVSTDRASLNAEAQQLLAEIQRVATTTQFNGQNILDGTFTSAQFQVGANANQTISASIGNGQTSALGAYQYNNTSSAVNGTTALVSGDLTISGVNVGASTSGSAESMVNAINSVTNQTGVSASATTSIVASNAPTGKQALSSGDLVINGVAIGSVAGSYNYATQGAAIALAINGVQNSTGVTASANALSGSITLTSTTGKNINITTNNGVAGASRVENATGLELSASTAAATETLTINGTKQISKLTFAGTVANGDTFTLGGKTFILDNTGGATGTLDGSGNTILNNASWTAANALTEAIAAINGVNGVSTVVASAGAAGQLVVTSKIAGIEASPTSVLADGNMAAHLTTGSAITTAGAGVTEGNVVTVDGTNYTFVVGTATGNQVSMSMAGGTADATDRITMATALAAAITANHSATGSSNLSNVTAANGGTNVVTVSSVLKGTAGQAGTVGSGTATGAGKVAVAVGPTATDGAYTASATYGIISLTSNSNYSVGGNNAGKAGLSTASSTLNAISAIDISSVTGANSAISLIDGALSQVATTRGTLGALQNRFESTVASLSSTSINLSAARSRILDTDFAAETANLTRNQILQQAGVAMLAQANALPNTVLSLLK